MTMAKSSAHARVGAAYTSPAWAAMILLVILSPAPSLASEAPVYTSVPGGVDSNGADVKVFSSGNGKRTTECTLPQDLWGGNYDLTTEEADIVLKPGGEGGGISLTCRFDIPKSDAPPRAYTNRGIQCSLFNLDPQISEFVQYPYSFIWTAKENKVTVTPGGKVTLSCLRKPGVPVGPPIDIKGP